MESFRAAVGIFKESYYKSTPSEDDPDKFGYVVPDPDGDDTLYSTMRFGENWIRGPSFEFFMGEAIHAVHDGKVLRAGMTRKEVCDVLGAPSYDEGEFLVWSGNEQDSNNRIHYYDWEHMYRAHFDEQGRLDAWMTNMEGHWALC